MAIIAGLVCGVLTGLGIGGGSLLIVWLTAVAGVSPKEAATINLIYFLAASLSALPLHWHAHRINWSAAVPAGLFGLPAAWLAAKASAGLHSEVLQICFGLLLVILSLSELSKACRTSG